MTKSTQTETPRTDAQPCHRVDFFHDDGHRREGWMVPKYFARQLETELAASAAEVERYRKALEEITNTLGSPIECETNEERKVLKIIRAALTPPPAAPAPPSEEQGKEVES